MAYFSQNVYLIAMKIFAKKYFIKVPSKIIFESSKLYFKFKGCKSFNLK